MVVSWNYERLVKEFVFYGRADVIFEGICKAGRYISTIFSGLSNPISDPIRTEPELSLGLDRLLTFLDKMNGLGS